MRQSTFPSAPASAHVHGSARTRVAATLSALALAGGVTVALLGAFGGASSAAAAGPASHSASVMHGNGTQMG